MGAPGGCCSPALGHTKVARGGQQRWDITVQEGCIAVGQGVGQVMGWDGAGRQWVLHTHPTESFCSPQPPLHLGSPVPAGVQGWSRVASRASWVVPPLGGSQSRTRDKGSQPLSQPASTCCGYIPIPAALEGQRPWGETSWCLQQRLGSQDQGFPELKGRRYPRGTACHHLPRSPAGKRR